MGFAWIYRFGERAASARWFEQDHGGLSRASLALWLVVLILILLFLLAAPLPSGGPFGRNSLMIRSWSAVRIFSRRA